MSFLFGRSYKAASASIPTANSINQTESTNTPTIYDNHVQRQSSLIGQVTSMHNDTKSNQTQKQTSTKLTTTSINELGAYQPNNPYKDLVLLPYFDQLVTHVCTLDDEKRFITADELGNLWVWDGESGILVKKLELHQSSINGIIKLKMSHQFTNKLSFDHSPGVVNYAGDTLTASSSSVLASTESNLLVVSSIDKTLSIWDTDSYKLIKSIRYEAHSSLRVFLNYENRYFICAGPFIQIYEVNLMNMLNLVDEHVREGKNGSDNVSSIRHVILIKNDKLAVSTNSDVEIYGLVYLLQTNELINVSHAEGDIDEMITDRCHISSDMLTLKLKELKRFTNAHKETINCLEKLSDNMFASGSSDGSFLIFHSESLTRLFDLKPFDELNRNESLTKMNPTSIGCFKSLEINSNLIVICSGRNICIYDFLERSFCFRLPNAHQSKINDLVLLNNNQIATSSEDGVIRIWHFFNQTISSTNDVNRRKLSMELIGECLGHSESIHRLYTISKNEILSVGYDNMIILWRNAKLMASRRNENLNKILTNIEI